MATIYSYLRFSSLEQAQGDSTRRQLAYLPDYLKRHPQHTLDTSLTLRDEGISAFRGANLSEKGALGKFIQAARTGKVKKGSILALENLDRFSRMPAHRAYGVFGELVDLGVKILTFDPEQLIDDNNIDDTAMVLTVIIRMQLGYEESKKKSQRVGKAWAQKKANADQRKLSRVCPAWLRLSPDRKTFELIPQSVQTVRDIFRWTVEGVGASAIVKRLIDTDRPVLASKKNSGKWHKSYVLKILHNRATIGEYQPHTGHGAANRKPIGEPIPNYYPAIIKPNLFYAAQETLTKRKKATSPNVNRVASLFTGIAKDARDGSNMTVIDKGDGLRLVSSDAHRGAKGAVYLSFPYDAFERGFLQFTRELKTKDVLPATGKTTQLQDTLDSETGRLKEIHHTIQSLAKALKGRNIEAVVERLADLEREEKECAAQVEKLKGELAQSENNTLSETHKIIDLLERTEGEELLALRRRLKETVRHLIKEIVVLVEENKPHRTALVECRFASGGTRVIRFYSDGQVEGLNNKVVFRR